MCKYITTCVFALHVDLFNVHNNLFLLLRFILCNYLLKFYVWCISLFISRVEILLCRITCPQTYYFMRTDMCTVNVK